MLYIKTTRPFTGTLKHISLLWPTFRVLPKFHFYAITHSASLLRSERFPSIGETLEKVSENTYKLLLLVSGEAGHLLFICFHLLLVVLEVTNTKPRVDK